MSKAPRNPNKRQCVARNITFKVEKENIDLLRKLPKSELQMTKKRSEKR